jgi:hypothetical protein
MYRLLVNPGTPQAWEIQLKPGVNRIGRNEENDFTIPHTSVSGSHCEITISEAGVLLKDLGSTNGTFVNRAPVREVWLQPGQHVQFGPVDMAFESDTMPPAVPAAASPPIPIPVPVPASGRPLTLNPAAGGLRITKPHAEESTEPPPEVEEEAELPPGGPATVDAGNAVCKFHIKTPARFLCNRCRKYFCDLCVTTRGVGKYCRTCGQPCTPLRVQAAQPATEKGFFARLPEAAIYPFKGSGLLVLIAATLVFAGLDAMSGGWFFLLIKIMAVGYLYSFMQNIIHATAAEEAEMPELPGFDDLFSACFRFVAVVVLCFGPPIAMLIANFFDAELPMSLIIATAVLGCLYFPMAFLAVAMKDNVMAANPLVVIPAILKVPGEYLVAAILLTGVFGVRLLGDSVAGGMEHVSLTTRKMSTLFMSFGVRAIWSFASVYLLTISMRILGLLYVTKKHKFGWFAH